MQPSNAKEPSAWLLKDASCIDLPSEEETPLIAGLLHKGETMMISGPPKSGKTLLAMQLALCVATGSDWLGRHCEKGAVLYLNLEVRARAFEKRMKEMEEASDLIPDDGMLIFSTLEIESCEDTDIFLEGVHNAIAQKATPPSLLIVDPLYWIGDSDENSTQGMKRILKPLKRVAQTYDAGVVVVHHHSKGYQGNKSTLDRNSGSGTIGRFFATILDLMPVRIPTGAIETQLIAMEAERFALPAGNELSDTHDWRGYVIESIVREFEEPPHIGVWFRYPLFFPDQTGLLEKARYANVSRNKQKAAQDPDERLAEAIDKLKAKGISPPTFKQIKETLGMSRTWVSNNVKNSSMFKAVAGPGREKVVVPIRE